jgi:hypothetical protein
MVKVIICGGRVGRNLSKRRVYSVLDECVKTWTAPIQLVHGNAAWVDTWGGQWARESGYREIAVPISGQKDGHRPDAPFRRNARMLAEHLDADVCLGFPGGGGTFDMMERCHDAGIPVGDVEFNDDGTWEIKWWPKK